MGEAPGVMNPDGLKRNLVSRAFGHVSRHGVSSLLQNLIGKLGNHWYDFREGTDTAGVVGLGGLSIASPNKHRGVYYGATKQRPFLEVLERVAPPKACTFVDVGCGKGKVLLMAMDYGFNHVTGIEFSSELCAFACRNVEAVRRRRGLACEIEVLECDATDYPVRPGDGVFFLFHPFDESIMSIFIEHVAESVRRHPRPIWLIYSYPVHNNVIEKHPLFSSHEAYHVRGTPYMVYRNAWGPPPAAPATPDAAATG